MTKFLAVFFFPVYSKNLTISIIYINYYRFLQTIKSINQAIKILLFD